MKHDNSSETEKYPYLAADPRGPVPSFKHWQLRKDDPTLIPDDPSLIPKEKKLLPDDPKARKEYPLGTGCLDYFSDALIEVSHISYVGNQQHNPGQDTHWARGKSMDQADCLLRHFLDRGTLDNDGLRHTAKLAWRALAMLQLELEAELGLAPSRGSKLPDGNENANKP